MCQYDTRPWVEAAAFLELSPGPRLMSRPDVDHCILTHGDVLFVLKCEGKCCWFCVLHHEMVDVLCAFPFCGLHAPWVRAQSALDGSCVAVEHVHGCGLSDHCQGVCSASSVSVAVV
jgi:hypothetical protein